MRYSFLLLAGLLAVSLASGCIEMGQIPESPERLQYNCPVGDTECAIQGMQSIYSCSPSSYIFYLGDVNNSVRIGLDIERLNDRCIIHEEVLGVSGSYEDEKIYLTGDEMDCRIPIGLFPTTPMTDFSGFCEGALKVFFFEKRVEQGEMVVVNN